MKVLEGIAGLRSLPAGGVISIGNYDGVHIGHMAIIDFMQKLAKCAPVAVVTFEPHPLTVLRPSLVPPRLCSADRKRSLLAEAGVASMVVLPPSPDVLGLTAEQFWLLLRDEVQPAHIVEGRAFNFGKDRGGTIERLAQWASDTPIGVHVVPSAECVLCDQTVIDVSSTMIRWLLGYGRVADANRCLGRAFELTGRVVKGFQRGRSIGFSTANLDCADLLIPADGVYAGSCQVDDRDYPVAISIGSTPTFEQQQYQVEAHLIGYTGDLYDRTITLRVHQWVRDQLRFPSIDELKAQLKRDVQRVVEVISASQTPDRS
jgi:riboflavin kinase/FMN adenylyltransferase